MTKKRATYQLKWLTPAIIISEICFILLLLSTKKILNLFLAGKDAVEFTQENMLNVYWYSLLIPLGVLFHTWRYNSRLKKFDASLLTNIFSPVSSRMYFLRYIALRAAFYFLVIAMAQPASGNKKAKGTKEALELVVCIDVSNSMNVKDISPEKSRLDITKRALSQLINQLHGERIGICIFANSAFVQLPVTHDYGAAKLFIQDIETNMVSNQGTNVKTALEVASNMFSPEKTAKGILLITDGENHEEDPTEIFSKLKKTHIQVMIMGIGTANGGLIPNDPNRPELGYKKNAMGATVQSKLNKSFLNKLAQKAGTDLLIADDEFPDLTPLLTEINHMKRVKIDNLEFEIKEERYQIPLFLGLASWLLFILLQFVFTKK